MQTVFKLLMLPPPAGFIYQ